MATPEIEAILVEYARHTTGAQLEKICRMYASVVKHDAGTRPSDDLERRTLRWRDLDDGMVMLQVVLHPEEAACVKEAIERIAAERCRERNDSAKPMAPALVSEADPSRAASQVAWNGIDSAGPCPEDDSDALPIGCEVEGECGDSSNTHRADAQPRLHPGSAEPRRSHDDCGETHRSSAERGRNHEAERAARNRARELRDSARQRSFDRAGALVAMAQEIVRGTAKQRSPINLVVTSTLETLVRSTSVGGTAQPNDVGVVGGICISSAAVRRLACDCAVTQVLEDEHGNALSIGRKTRRIPGAMKAALLRADQTCRYPGCNARAFLEGHHAVHWADGGATEISNLLCLCGWHHRFVHEYGFDLSMDGNRQVTVTDPRGRRLIEVPRRQVGPQVGVPMIQAANANLGISAETPWCGWDGSAIDYPACIDGLLAPERRRIRAQLAAGRGGEDNV